MIKRDELASPNSCINRARDDDLVFVLLERDKAAPIASLDRSTHSAGKEQTNGPANN